MIGGDIPIQNQGIVRKRCSFRSSFASDGGNGHALAEEIAPQIVKSLRLIIKRQPRPMFSNLSLVHSIRWRKEVQNRFAG
jgi:hypothetical protein